MHSHAAPNGIGEQTAYMTLNFAEWFSGFSMPMTWPRTFIFRRCMADVREPPQFCFLTDLDLFFDCDTHLNNGLRLPSLYTAVFNEINSITQTSRPNIKFLKQPNKVYPTTADERKDLSSIFCWNNRSVCEKGGRRPVSAEKVTRSADLFPTASLLQQLGRPNYKFQKLQVIEFPAILYKAARLATANIWGWKRVNNVSARVVYSALSVKHKE